LPLKRALTRFGVKQPACRALVDAQYGIGGLLAVAVWRELGDCQRFSRSRQAVRHTGLDVTVDASNRRRAVGYLTRQGPETLRWALYEAAKNSSHQCSPDHAYYARLKERHGGKIAAIAVARQITRRCYHILRNLESDVVYTILWVPKTRPGPLTCGFAGAVGAVRWLSGTARSTRMALWPRHSTHRSGSAAGCSDRTVSLIAGYRSGPIGGVPARTGRTSGTATDLITSRETPAQHAQTSVRHPHGRAASRLNPITSRETPAQQRGRVFGITRPRTLRSAPRAPNHK
jgi:hypothetical protein